MEAINYARTARIDVVLVDTAGRMQDNEPLMRALSKLISVNAPDLVLFVGKICFYPCYLVFLRIGVLAVTKLILHSCRRGTGWKRSGGSAREVQRRSCRPLIPKQPSSH